MSYKTILAYAETSDDLEKVMPVAMMIAKNHRAHVIGLHVIRNHAVTMRTPYQIDLIVKAEESLRHAAEEQAEVMGKTFEAYVSGEADAIGEWRVVKSETANVDLELIDHARCCDLTIIAQPDPSKDPVNRLATLGETILQTGRPVLVVPYAWNAKSLASNVFVAWNKSREGTRAIFDAMPFLHEAASVRLCGVTNEKNGDDGKTLPAAELATTLARHDVNVTTETVTTGKMSVASTLLSRLGDHGSDLLVMGGYGHSRAREYVFGGVTRDILKVMTVPVLFSH